MGMSSSPRTDQFRVSRFPSITLTQEKAAMEKVNFRIRIFPFLPSYFVGKSKHGRKGGDVVLEVPCGTIVKEVVRSSGREEVCMPVCDLDKHDMRVVVANGGEPGLGNSLLRGKFLRNSPRRLAAQKTTSKPSDVRFLELELKLIAHVGLVG